MGRACFGEAEGDQKSLLRIIISYQRPQKWLPGKRSQESSLHSWTLKVFALFNVRASIGNTISIRPNYLIDVPKLFQEVMEYLFRELGYFWLTYLDLFRTHDTRSDLPSWVPDWSMDDQEKIPLSSTAVLLYRASNIWYDPKAMHTRSKDCSGRHFFPFSIEDGSLKVSALRLDRVAHVGPFTSGEILFFNIWGSVLSLVSHFSILETRK
jgi:hypothetical protein